MPDTPHIAVKLLPSISLEEERNALRAVYALCLQKHREKEKANKPAPEPVGRDGTRIEGDSAHARIISE